MSHTQRQALSTVLGPFLLVGLVLTALQACRPPQVDYTAWFLFTGLFVFTNTFGFPLGGGSVNLVPVATVGGLLVLDPLATTWMALVGSIPHALVRWAYGRQLGATREPGSWLAVAGVGLAFCRLAVESHHGRSYVSSRPGLGSTFTISLPAVEARSTSGTP